MTAYGLMIGFFYWQVVPLLLVTAGVTLEIKKLIVYPVPHSQLFLLDAILRVSTGMEVLIMIGGASIGIMLNPRLPVWSALAFLPYIAFNLAFAAGVREFLSRVMARRFLREIAMLMLVLIGALPQFILLLGDRVSTLPGMRALPVLARIGKEISQLLPWTPTSEWAMGRFHFVRSPSLILWAIAAWIFGRWQFERGLRFDTAAAQTAAVQNTPPARWSEWAFFLAEPGLSRSFSGDDREGIPVAGAHAPVPAGLLYGLLIWIIAVDADAHARQGIDQLSQR